MKARLLLMLAGAGLLAGCSASPASTSSAATSGEASAEASEAESEVQSEEGSSEASTASVDPDTMGWTQEEAASIREVLNGILVPSFDMTDYTFESSAEEGYFEALGIASTTELAYYVDILEDLDFEVTLYEESMEIEGSLFAEDYSYAYVYISLEQDTEGSEDYVIDLYGSYFLSSPTWPTEEIAASRVYNELTEDIPALEGAEGYVHYITSYYGFFYISAIECYGTNMNQDALDGYFEKLEGAGYKYDEELYAYDNGKTIVEAYLQTGYILVYAYGYTSEGGGSGSSSGSWTAPEEGDGVFNFSNQSQLTTRDASKSVWTAGNATFTVEKGTATVDVGNGSYFSDPLRLYTNQVVTISSNNAFSSISFYFVEEGKSDPLNLTSLEVDGASWSENEETGTIDLVFDADVESTSFTLTEGQVRFQYAVVVYAA